MTSRSAPLDRTLSTDTEMRPDVTALGVVFATTAVALAHASPDFSELVASTRLLLCKTASSHYIIK